jgi:hypothetical protein
MNLIVVVFNSVSVSVWTESVLSRRLSLNPLLTSFDTDSGTMNHTKVVDNFDSFLASINMLSFYERFVRTMLGSSSPVTAGRRLWPKNLDTTRFPSAVNHRGATHPVSGMVPSFLAEGEGPAT